MLKYTLEHRKAVDVVMQCRDLGLRKFELTDEEWEIAGQLRDVLKILKDATLFFSRSTPSLATVIPAMDLIDDKLTSYLQDHKYLPAIRAAVCLAKKTVNRYYELTDTSEVYRIAMVLHPRHKLSYFKNAGWEDEWVDTAEALVRDEFERSYEHTIVNNDSTDNEDNGLGVPEKLTKGDSSMVCFLSISLPVLMLS
ncbi:uncharacterized protein F5891DRAFT_959346 [Suillus fuscotomentosus]|uniref:hAT-like transposase RNase-H fold domain-containing protein n=1 Tax=Suillus fuscotomentosus TaxID=1912939 RepID=A0AAD4DXM3_9AGAM|nr:uncharacterized protein F5891DRAFT_959346 [Suillus fuscotomentosus]KAG1895975.1 hypothetical protein F5891DRAFT_959346 [Suillus fuscotomentosus]